MRSLTAGACVRTLLVLVLVLGAVLAGMEPAGAPLGQASSVSARRAKEKPKDQENAKQEKKGGKQAKKGGKKGNHRGKKAPASLDAARITAQNADTVEDLACGDDLTAIQVDGRVFCTHGEDPPLPDPEPESIQAERRSGARAASQALCIDDGQSGPRVQIVYVRPNNRGNRYGELLTKMRRLAFEMDLIFDQSAQKTGESRRVRYVTDEDCQVDIQELTVSEQATDGFGSLIQKMHAAGYDRIDRKYLMSVDDNVFCGVGSYNHGDGRTTDAHNFTGYARVDLPCWDAGSMAHELSHTLGAVQFSSPHTSRGAHCVNEWDVMCYSDEPFKPKMRVLCDDGAQDFRLDCNNDDYYAANPEPGSYLDRHWNAADSMYLTAGPGIECADVALEPDDAYWYAFWKVPMPEFEIGTTQEHAFCGQEGDTDWVMFLAKAGTTYKIETSRLAAGVDTELVLYRGFKEQGWSGMDIVASNDDREEDNPASAITYTAPSDGSYLVGIANAEGAAGRGHTYSLSISAAPNPLAAQMTLSPDRAHPGAKVNVAVSGFQKDEEVTVWLQREGNAQQLGEMDTNNDGIDEESFQLPGDLQPRVYRIEALGADGSAASASLKIVKKQSDKHKNKKGGKKKHKRG